MKYKLLAAALAFATVPVFAADVGVSISIGQPGFYGRINIGDFPQPRVIYPQPVIIERVPYERPPVYLRVPPGHAKHWEKHCREYNACGERVYFVQDSWYENEYVPRYQERYQGRHDDRDDDDRGRREDRDEGRGDHGRGRDHDHGHH